jgi:tRNA pseudouridine32 synthase/23S rRNA pseudouridine746 synthase
MQNGNGPAEGFEIQPSRLYLPKLETPPATIFEHLLSRFPQVQPNVWRDRISRDLVTLSDGAPVREDSPYRHGVTVFYRKEVPSEPGVCEEAFIVYRDENILIVDKPHGMPVTPAGQYVERALLVRLQRSTGLSTLSPMHRLDHDTAGLLLLTVKAAVRGRYHRLFSERMIEREYLAIAGTMYPPTQNHWRVENRMESGEPWFRQRIVEGPANAFTAIELLELREGKGLFRLHPRTGRKHQLRVHMASLGFPIIGDPFYPEIKERQNEDPPLQLLASRLTFIDPLSGESRNFTSTRRLHWE